MGTTVDQKRDGRRFELGDSEAEDLIVQQREDNDSTPRSTQSSESDDLNNEVAEQGFERFREGSVCSVLSNNSPCSPTFSIQSPVLQDSIAEYCTESLYSYSFTPLSRVNKAARIKKQILNRGMDYMQRIRWKNKEKDSVRRFSEPDIGVVDDWNDTTSELKTCPSMIDMSTGNHLGSCISPKQPKEKESLRPPKLLVEATPHTTTEVPRDTLTEDEELLLARRQTIEVFNNLPPIYEVPDSNPSSISPQYTRALHAPSRFLPQNQAILTTDADGTILLFNDMASLCFGIDKSYIGKSILKAIEEPFQKQISQILKRRKSITTCDISQENGLVLVCGVVVPIRKMNGETSSAASLWLKEKKTDEGKSIYIWIFEEIYETSLTVHLDDQGMITKVIGATKDLVGYEPDGVIGKPITLLIPALTNGNVVRPGVNLKKIKDVKFYGGRSKHGSSFPTMVTTPTPSQNVLKIVSLPSIAGLITIHSTGKIQSINPVPAKYLFGYSPDELVEKFEIDQIIPQFSDVVNGLRRCNLLKYSCTVNNHACRWAISEMCTGKLANSVDVEQSLKSLERVPSISGNGQALPLIHAVHRDGSQFEIQLQLRLIESDMENLISIWVTYDRIHAQKRSKRAAIKSEQQQQHQQQQPAAQIPTKVTRFDNLSHPLSPTLAGNKVHPSTPIHMTTQEEPKSPPVTTAATEEKSKDIAIPKRPPIRTYGVSSFGSVDQKRALFPQSFSESDSRSSSVEQVDQLQVQENTNKEKKPHPMDDYVIIGTLGEGAYGTAKLAYRKDDITKTKVVIKFIAKSRIIVDSWIRDRQLGLIPLEIHILKKLKESPQDNCCALESYMEDEDTYFVVMKLYGNSSMDLFDYIELNEHISETEVRNIFMQVALAVKHIQSLRIVHRDIKDENILLDENGCVHLIDFGSAAYFRKGRTFDTFGGTLDYCAPEILKGMSYEGPAQDIWSLGTLLYTLIYRENPFYNVDEIMEHDLRIPFVMSEGSLDLIKKMLNRDVDKRYDINQVLEHPWLKQSQATTIE